jgi:hypothetical protein
MCFFQSQGRPVEHFCSSAKGDGTFGARTNPKGKESNGIADRWVFHPTNLHAQYGGRLDGTPVGSQLKNARLRPSGASKLTCLLLYAMAEGYDLGEPDKHFGWPVSVHKSALPTLKQALFPEYIVATACLLIKQANQAMMGRGNALDRGQTKITQERAFNTSLCKNKFKSMMQSKTVLTWANCLHHGIILPDNVKGGDCNLLNEHQIYPYLVAMAPIIPPYNAN